MENLPASGNYLRLTTITLEETEDIERTGEPVTMGIPFPRGFLLRRDKNKTPNLLLNDVRNSVSLPVQTQVTATWPDNSVKWLLFDFQASVGAKSSRKLDLILDKSGTVSDIQTGMLSAEEDLNYVSVNTEAAHFFVNTRVFKPFDRVVRGEEKVLNSRKSETVLTDESGIRYEPLIENIFFESKGPLRATLKIEGAFKNENGTEFASFFSRISFFSSSSMAKIEFTILNPGAAKHPGGLWDLGDSGSVFFRDLSLCVALNSQEDTEIIWTTGPDQRNMQDKTRNLLIYQDSGGGKNWDSPNHVNRNGEVRNTFRGYRVYSDGKKIEEGTRAAPCIAISDDRKSIAAGIQYFWQNFPKALEASRNTVKIGLFPENYDDVFELQGGEQKTHTVFLDFDFLQKNSRGIESIGALVQSPLIPHADPEWYSDSGAFAHLIPENDEPDKELTGLISTAIKGENTFFHRREIIDEYGWRNFGEFYADHEAEGHKGPDTLISHYNNQYDCIYGTLFQFARSGNIRWFLLADQLCRHVRDIDIYHTDDDRPEYNRGLLWHTEHYLDVETAGHRCFSKKHAPHRNMDAYGGGPSLSHLYSTGLLLHYHMTGSLSSKEAALELASFVLNNMDMANTLSGKVIRGLRKTVLSLKNMLGKEELVEFAKVYELDGPGRASGNALSTLTNAYMLTEDRTYMEKAESLICACIHPEDDIEKRDLSDIENRWMYTVFLQALGKYLDMKTGEEQFDDMWQYARLSLLRYAEWMLENEYPYLEKPEKLEYPNETWAAQDIRKCNVMLYAAGYAASEMRPEFLEKAAFFHMEAKKYLFTFETRTLTRPMALLMLNAMMHSHAGVRGVSPALPDEFLQNAGCSVNRKARSAFSFKNEVQFLKWRL